MPAEARILVVDDEEMVRTVTVQLLRAKGFSACAAKGGGEALHLFRTDPEGFDAALLDVLMPGIKGEVTALELRLMDGTLPLVFMSGRDEEDIRSISLPGTGPMAYILKPFYIDDLVARLREVLAVNIP